MIASTLKKEGFTQRQYSNFAYNQNSRFSRLEDLGPWLQELCDTHAETHKAEKLSVFDYGEIGEGLTAQYVAILTDTELLYVNIPADAIMHLDASGDHLDAHTLFALGYTLRGDSRHTYHHIAWGILPNGETAESVSWFLHSVRKERNLALCTAPLTPEMPWNTVWTTVWASLLLSPCNLALRL